MIVNANGVELYVDIQGDGTPVLLLHGWPDSAALWRNQIPVPAPRTPPVTAATLGIWSDGDRYLDGARMRASGELVKGPPV
jgi:pimeloyl-ACP methyl ester carboxylesterase